MAPESPTTPKATAEATQLPATLVIRIDLAAHPSDLEPVLVATCDNRHSAGYRLAASFVLQADLVLIFQRP